MQALAPSGVGLPAPDCLVSQIGDDKPVALSRLFGPTQQYLVLLPSIFGHEPLLALLAECSAPKSTVVITADNTQALAQAALPAQLSIYSDPTLSFARLYGCTCAPSACRPALFHIQNGWIKQSFICEQVHLPTWRALLEAHCA